MSGAWFDVYIDYQSPLSSLSFLANHPRSTSHNNFISHITDELVIAMTIFYCFLFIPNIPLIF